MTRESSKQTKAGLAPEETSPAYGEPIEKTASAEAKQKKPRKRKPAEINPIPPFEKVKPAVFAPSPPETPSVSTLEAGPDPFDPAKFRYDPQNTGGLTQRVWTEGQVPIRKPNDQEWFRVRPEDGRPSPLPKWQLPASILLLKHDKKYRLIAPGIAPAVGEAKPMILRLCTTIGGDPILWPVPLPAADGRDYQYWESARAIATEAETHWIRMTSNLAAGCYNSIRATADYGAPKWPELTLGDWLRLAFGKNGIVDSLDHPDLKRLRGEG